jgi:hypothetical protein
MLLRACCHPCAAIPIALHPCFPPEIVLLLALHVLAESVPPVVIHYSRQTALRHMRVLLLHPGRRPQSPWRVDHRVPPLWTLVCWCCSPFVLSRRRWPESGWSRSLIWSRRRRLLLPHVLWRLDLIRCLGRRGSRFLAASPTVVLPRKLPRLLSSGTSHSL